MNNQVSTKEFLVLLFGKCTDGCITITTLPDARTEHIPVQQLDKAAEHIAVHGRTSNTYYGTALRCEGLSANVRGSAGQVHTVVCMYADIDVAGPAHKESHLPQTTEEAITFVNTLKVKPSIIVQSGNGIHAIWLLDMPFIIHNEDEREHIRNVSAGFGIYVVEEGRKNGWKLDNVQDVARMLRAPGTLNFKSDPPKACEVLQAEDIRYPLDVFEAFKRTVEDTVFDIEAFETVNRDNLPTHRQIERMGWIDSREFFPYHMDSIAVYDGANDESHRIISAVVPHGDKEKWLEMAAKLRTMHAARVMRAASFASVLLYPLQQRPFILHLWANSRSGKTAVLKAAISIYGDPNVLLRSYNSTAVGIERTAAIMQNIPLALDELQSLSMKYENLARMTYMLGNGIGKMRGDRTGGTQNQPTWRNTILSTGEQPITSENSMDGESTRVMELYAPPIDDTDFAREVHQTVAEHYGFAGQMFMDYLFREYALEKDTCRLREAYIAFRDEFTSDYEMIYDKCTSIYRDYAALLAFADYLSSKAVFGADDQKAYGSAWELGVNLLEALKKDAKNDAIERAWTAVNEWVVSNKDHFEVKRGDLPSNNYGTEHEPIYGRYAPKDEKLYILPGALSRMLTDNGFSPEKSVKGFKERGYISGKQEQHRVGKGSVKVIIANIKLDYTQYDPPLLE